MAVIESGVGGASNLLAVDTYRSSARVALVPFGACYSVSGTTGTIAAALAANSSVFAMRLDPGAAVKVYLHRLRMQYTTITAYTTPVTAGRRLALFRGSLAAASAGTALAAVAHATTDPASEVNAAQGGDVRIATTGALTVTGITFEADPLVMWTLSHVGAAGGFSEVVVERPDEPIVLQPGQLLAVRNPAAMDAAGTWTLAVTAIWSEAA